jgi:tetratricopeptide (TPR) repeat protein
VLGTFLVALVPAFAVTHTAVSRYKAQRHSLAEAWRARGRRDVTKDPSAAAVDFQTALSYEDRASDRLALAEALIAAHRPAEAKAQLLTLWALQPGDGQINLDLGRLAAADDNVSDAVRYYHSSIDGAWDEDAASERREGRLELAQFLIANGQSTAAQAELIALSDNLPEDARTLTSVGALLIESGADRRAMPLLEHALRLDPADGVAARMAGGIEFRAAAYRSARRYFQAAEKHGALDAEARNMRDVSGRVLALDPMERGIGARARTARVIESMAVARKRLERCKTASPVDAATRDRLADLEGGLDDAEKVRPRALDRDVDLTEQTMTLVFDIEGLPAASCGPDSADDQALQLIAGQRRAAAR